VDEIAVSLVIVIAVALGIGRVPLENQIIQELGIGRIENENSWSRMPVYFQKFNLVNYQPGSQCGIRSLVSCIHRLVYALIICFGLPEVNGYRICVKQS
jgi:hypothetical protein